MTTGAKLRRIFNGEAALPDARSFFVIEMTRHAFKMKLKPGNVAEYKMRHDEIWPELSREIRAEGISDYSIFWMRKRSRFFAVQKLSDKNSANDLPSSPIVRKWWNAMAPLMERILTIHPLPSRCGKFFTLIELDCCLNSFPPWPKIDKCFALA